MKKLLVVPMLLVVVFAFPAFADPGPTDPPRYDSTFWLAQLTAAWHRQNDSAP